MSNQCESGLFIRLWMFALCMVWISNLDAQPFLVGHRQITFFDAERNGRAIPTEIYYPSDIEGDNVAVAGMPEESYPLLVFGHGFVMEWSAYSNFWNELVPEGYIIVFPRTETGISPDHENFARDLAFIVRAMQEEGHTNGSPFLGRLDSTSCVMGHSMGGGCSFLAVQFNENISAIVNFAAAETNPSAISVCPSIDLPVLLFAGDKDCITPPPSNQELMYDGLSGNCKTLVQISGASHCQFSEQNVFCSFGELTCNTPAGISREEQHHRVDTLLIPWLAYHLKGQCEFSSVFQNILTDGSGWTYQEECAPCIPLGSFQLDKRPSYEFYPMPSNGKFYLKGYSGVQPRGFRIYDMKGKLVFQQTLDYSLGQLWDFEIRLPAGLYYVAIWNETQMEIIKVIFQS